MADKRIGVAAMGGDSRTVVARIQHLEELGIEAAWLTSGGAGPDALTTFAAAAAVTDRILMGTSIIPTYPRHPIVAVAQTQVVAQMAPGRFRLGLGPSHKVSIEPMFGIEHNAPLTNLREYIQVVKQLLWEGQVDYDGTQYHGHGSLPGAPAPDVPVMASALRRRSFRLCGEVADGAISWVCPGQYLRDVALPEMQRGAAIGGRDVPPLIAHAPVCVHENAEEVREAARSQLANYPRSPFYQEMFAASGHPEARESAWSDGMIEDVVLSGDEETVAGRLRELFDWGATEILAHPISAGGDSQASVERSLNLIATVGQGL
ncbi:MAG: LLM class flavin-dependent oxidoreductase [Chloroflexota bacterium]|nr:LLM class flavin-dependent oxidoreductase [Chloroflexota bacterium]